MQITISAWGIKRILGAVIFLNISMLIGSAGFHFHYYDYLGGRWENVNYLSHILLQFSLHAENTIATWYSSMLLLGVSIMSFFCFHIQFKGAKLKSDKRLSYGWLFFLAIFALLSFDEVGSMHERIGSLTVLNPFSDYPLGWIFIFSVPIAVVGVFMIAFCLKQFKYSTVSAIFAIIGILCYLSLPFQEHIETTAWHSAEERAYWQRPLYNLLLEEGTEIFGTFFMLTATFIFALKGSTVGNTKLLDSSINLRLNYPNKKLVFLAVLVFLLLGAISVILQHSSLLQSEADTGIQRNWFPAAIAFFVFLSSFHLFFKNKTNSKVGRYLWLGIFSVFISAYFGSNIYNLLNWLFAGLKQNILTFFLILITVAIALAFILKTPNYTGRIFIAGWCFLLSTVLFYHGQYAAVLCYVSFSLLVAWFWLNNRQETFRV